MTLTSGASATLEEDRLAVDDELAPPAGGGIHHGLHRPEADLRRGC